MVLDKKKKANMMDKTYIFNNFAAACDKFEDLQRTEKIPDEIFAVAYHRRFIKRTHAVFESF